jgi:GntR family transcriptional regulator
VAINWKLSGKQDVYVEVAEYFEDYILRGVFVAGDKLPSVRMAAGELSVNPNTVAKAYSMLEEKGYIRALPKKGAFVIYSANKPSNESGGKEAQKKADGENAGDEASEENQLAATICKNTLSALKNSGIDKTTLLKFIEEVYDND